MLRQVLMASLLTGATISTDTSAQDLRFYTRPGSKVPFSPAVRAGDYIHLSGQIGVADDGSVPPTMVEQARLAMEHVRDALALAGGTMDDIVKCTVMLDDMRQWAEFNTVYATFFKPGRLPARSAFGSRGLAFGAGVEVECLAYKPLASGSPKTRR